MDRKIHPHITCAFLYTITRYGYPPDARRMDEYLQEMAELGFQSAELEGIGQDHLRETARNIPVIRKALTDNGLSLAVFCTVLPHLGSVHAALRKQALENFREGCEIAVQLGAPAVLDNGPLVPYDFPADLPVSRHYAPELLRRVGLPRAFNWKTYWDDLVETIGQACSIAAQYGLKYYLHPCCGSLTETTDGFLRLKDAVGMENLKFNCDLSNQYYMRENLSLALLKLGSELDYIHISDNRGKQVEHLPAGHGDIDWDPLFDTLRQIGFKGQLSIDVGGAETELGDLDSAYLETAGFLERLIEKHHLFDHE